MRISDWSSDVCSSDLLSNAQQEKLQLFNDRVRTLHQSLVNKSKSIQEQQSLLANNDIILIPVVVHILWNTAAENLSNTQIQSQIDVLNEDFRRLNTENGRASCRERGCQYG